MTWMDLRDMMLGEKPDAKTCTLYDSIYINFKNKQKYSMVSQNKNYLWKGVLTRRDTKKISEMLGMFYIFIWVENTRNIYAYICHQT